MEETDESRSDENDYIEWIVGGKVFSTRICQHWPDPFYIKGFDEYLNKKTKESNKEESIGIDIETTISSSFSDCEEDESEDLDSDDRENSGKRGRERQKQKVWLTKFISIDLEWWDELYAWWTK